MALSEDDTRVKLIDPKIHEYGWLEEYLIRQFQIADDRFYVEGEEYKKLPTKKLRSEISACEASNISLPAIKINLALAVVRKNFRLDRSNKTACCRFLTCSGL